MSKHVVIDDKQQLHIINHEELDICLARNYKLLKSGSEKECNKFYDEYVEQYGYTGPIWEMIEV